MSKIVTQLNYLSIIKLIKHNIKYNVYKCKSFYKLKMAAGPVEQRKDRIIWIDLEMTGLNVTEDKVLEIASIITDDNLNIVSHEFEIVVNQSESVFKGMIPWCQEQHNKVMKDYYQFHHRQSNNYQISLSSASKKSSGLVEASRNSAFTVEMADEELVKFLKNYVPPKACPLAGNCLYMDRAFLQAYLPRTFNYLGDHVIDVSSINELAKRWNKKIERKKQRKTGDHRALGDIKDSIEELSYYKKNIFQ